MAKDVRRRPILESLLYLLRDKQSPKQRQIAPVLPIPVEGAFDQVAVDCLGPFPVSDSGNRYIVVFSDYLTRYPEAFAVPSIDAPTIADLLVNEILPRHRAPHTLLSERGSTSCPA